MSGYLRVRDLCGHLYVDSFCDRVPYSGDPRERKEKRGKRERE